MRIPPTITPEVARALLAGSAVVALESTLITHGLPWPENLAVAREAETAVRAAGAVPATVAVLGGEVRIGLLDAEVEHLARSTHFRKASRRDLSYCVAGRLDAATTVAATLRIARAAGIGLMATGGLGGVHRGASTTFDISTDLDELASAHGMGVVCSGVKSILDLPATLDALETRGVAVVGFGTDTLPAFTARSSGLPLDARVDTVEAAAGLIRAHRGLDLPGAIVLAQPVDAAVAVDGAAMDAAIAVALEAAKRAGVVGKAVTPFLLDEVRRATGGRSLVANKALIVANAGLAGRIAVEIARPA